ncbi:MAG TPA: dihydrofolate reductase family protein [Hyalangium sp.]|nr:dihydrofolate reductase family protein [Hyalangium sp.]
MGHIIYLMNVSLDGFVEGPDGKFDWGHSNEEVHQFHKQQVQDNSALLYGRRMYETMKVWQTLDTDPSVSDFMVEFARVWKSKPKIVFSTTLEKVGENCRLARGDIAAEVARLKQEYPGDLTVNGPGLASAFARLGLIDEYRLVISPVLVGGGKPYFPQLDHLVPLRLLETRTFQSGALYLRYQRA